MLGKEQVSALNRSQERDRLFGFHNCGGKEAQVIGWNTFEDTGDGTEAVRARGNGLQCKCSLGFRKTFLQRPKRLKGGVAFRARAPRSGDEVFGSATQFLRRRARQLQI